ncbi:MAG: UDP-glucose/GDP-mannose dehydrogenase family protein [Alphaproteobacteria bacterium]|nr:MAG: UDP-glucose/GDP-mannose dehydrogenase family protein [Alphaproteobacteria bacterium]
MIGTGYVGLVSGTAFAELGFKVTCVDVDQQKIDNLKNDGIIPIYEPGLEEMVRRNVQAGRLNFTTNLAEVVPSSDAIFIAVGTPQDEDGSADLQYVEAAARQIAPHLSGYTVIVNKSTVPVGTGTLVEDLIRETNPNADFDVASNPEFLREGEAVADFLKPDRVVVGVENERCSAFMSAIYKPLTDQGVPLHITNRASSELIKYAANAFLATKITFINELINLCDKVGADILSVSRGMGLDSRIAPRFLQPGPGYGGSCFPKDTNALAKTARDHGVRLNLVEETITTNQRIKEDMTQRIVSALGNVKGKTIAVLGLAFKANTDDMRDASSLTILPKLVEMGATVKVFDPAAMPRAKQLMPTLTYVESTEAAITGADAAVVLTEWADFRTLDLTQLKNSLAQPMLIDLRNLFNSAEVTAAGLSYYPLGRPSAQPDA